MLNSARTTVVCLLLAVGLLAAPTAAYAEGPEPTVHPCAQLDVCIGIEDGSTPAPGHTTSGGGGGGGGGAAATCSWNGKEWPCWDDDLGWFSTSDGCYYYASTPQPPAGDPAWGGHQPSEGAVYEVNCRGVDGQLTPKPVQFFATPPVAAQPRVRPMDVLNSLVNDVWQFQAPELHAAPTDNAVVGSPVWLWYDANNRTYGDRKDVSYTLHGLTIIASATRTDVTWDANDGQPVFTCKESTTPYRSDLPASAVAPCSHIFKASSAKAKDQKYFLTARYRWHIVARRTDTNQVFADFNKDIVTGPELGLRVAEVQLVN